MSEIGIKETTETKKPEVENYKEIKPNSGITVNEAKAFWDGKFASMDEKADNNYLDDGKEKTIVNDSKELKDCVKDYYNDVKSRSECPKTLSDRLFEPSELKKRSPEENAKMKEEFVDKKAELKRQWEEKNGREWPKYDKDVYSESGKLIRKAGGDYDAHHVQPLCLGGKNEVGNITPLHAKDHYDKQGVHSPSSPYSKMTQLFGGV